MCELTVIYCTADISVDAMDVSGGQQVDVDHDIKKRRLKADGTAISEEKIEELGNGTAVLDPDRSVSTINSACRHHILSSQPVYHLNL